MIPISPVATLNHMPLLHKHAIAILPSTPHLLLIPDQYRGSTMRKSMRIDHGSARCDITCLNWLLRLQEHSAPFHHACIRVVHRRLTLDLPLEG